MLRAYLQDEWTRCCVGVGKNADEAVRGRIVVSEGELENSEVAYNAQGQGLEGSPRCRSRAFGDSRASWGREGPGICCLQYIDMHKG
jgi:hypothetical protein